MLRFLYYKGYIEILADKDLSVLKEDIEHDYNNGIIEPHQYEFLTEKLNKRLNSNKIVYL